MRIEKKLSWLFAVLLLVVALMVTVPALASDDDRGGDVNVTQSNDMNNQTAGDINIEAADLVGGSISSSNKTFAFSHSLGDVDINEGQNCLGSEAWGTIIVSRQTNELNPWCAALFYELNGKHEFAAKMRCDIKEIGRKYETEAECWSDQDLTPVVPDHDIHSRSDAFEDTYGMVQQQQEEEIVVVQMAQTDLEQRVENLEQKPAPRPRVVQQEPAPRYSDEEFDAVWSALKGSDEDE